MNSGGLTRIDNRPIPENRDEVRAFMIVWNDLLRLESALKHHRQLGVQRFFIADSGSTDGTLDYLVSQPDVHVFSAAGEDSMAWLHTLLDTYGAGHWALTVDADELFIYPHCEELELPLFCRYLNYVGSQAVACVSLDMYAATPLRDVVHSPGAPLLGTCRYFDPAPYRMFQTSACPNFEIHGGVRERISGPLPPEQSAVLSRVPLVRWQAGMRYLRGTGNITPVRIASILAALLRFDFLSDFQERNAGGITLSEGLSTNLSFEGSVRYESTRQLLDLGLMTTAKAYEESLELTRAARAAQSA